MQAVFFERATRVRCAQGKAGDLLAVRWRDPLSRRPDRGVRDAGGAQRVRARAPCFVEVGPWLAVGPAAMQAGGH